MRLLWCLFLLCTSLTAHAVRVQILHTNDLHSHLEGAHGIGGYAQLATLIRTLKERAQAQGMETLVLDGGDFGEGSSFFFAHEGLTALRMLDELAIDVTVIGNHDLLQGGEELALLLRRAGLKAQVVSANIEDRFLNETHGLVKPMVVKSVAGLKIGIAGLTTSEPHYQYAIRSSGKVRDPLKEVGRVERLAKDAGVDFLIALTHIGSPRDVKLAERSRSIGLIVGAHSHERLQRALTRLAEEESLRARLGARARADVLERDGYEAFKNA